MSLLTALQAAAEGRQKQIALQAFPERDYDSTKGDVSRQLRGERPIRPEVLEAVLREGHRAPLRQWLEGVWDCDVVERPEPEAVLRRRLSVVLEEIDARSDEARALVAELAEREEPTRPGMAKTRPRERHREVGHG